MYLDPDQLPLALLANDNGEGLYGCCGYNVGTAALLLRLVAGLEKTGKWCILKNKQQDLKHLNWPTEFRGAPWKLQN